MSTTEDRARAAMRAIAGTVHDAPPLRLTQAQDPVPGRDLTSAADEARSGPLGAASPAPLSTAAARGDLGRGPSGEPWPGAPPTFPARPGSRRGHDRGRRRRAGDHQGHPERARGRASSPGGFRQPRGHARRTSATGVPEYYVAWMQADAPYLVVGNAFTGKAIATVKAPAGVALEAVYGAAADDRTFIVTGDRLHGADAGTAWYLLRIAPGSSAPARLTPLPVPVRQSPAGAALSPDGTKVAVALPGSPATLRVYSVATGALLREWSTTAPGELTAQKVPAGSRQFTAMVLRWSADGSQLAFAWNASAIRVLDATAPDGDLIARQQAAGGDRHGVRHAEPATPATPRKAGSSSRSPRDRGRPGDRLRRQPAVRNYTPAPARPTRRASTSSGTPSASCAPPMTARAAATWASTSGPTAPARPSLATAPTSAGPMLTAARSSGRRYAPGSRGSGSSAAASSPRCRHSRRPCHCPPA